jgi:hypothetical protein
MFIPYQTLSYAKILEKLNQLNLELERQEKFAKIIVTGGSAVSLLSGGYRETRDIDYIGSLPLTIEQLQTFQMSNDVEKIFVVPDISEVSFDKELNYSNLTVLVLSWEDLAIMKFYSTREKDLQDLKNFILPNIYDFTKLKTRLDYYKAYYIFDLNNPDLNVTQYTITLNELKHSHHILVVDPTQTLEQVLKANRLYSKFCRFAETYVIPLNFEVWLSTSVSFCMSDYGFAEFFQAATSYQIRI